VNIQGMPKTEIDYSNTIIYKITCKDTNVKDVYVGHTTNFVQRKHAHKQSCINGKSANYTCKLYDVIRNNGGWENWKMEIINFFQCHDHYEARQKEQEYFISLHATLNSIEPMPKPKPKETIVKVKKIKQHFHCAKCDIYCVNLQLFEKHNVSKKHMKKTAVIVENLQKYPKKFECKLCDYTCMKSSEYNKHVITRKHINRTLLNNLEQETIRKARLHICNVCKKEYTARNSLWYHKKKCIQVNNVTENVIFFNV